MERMQSPWENLVDHDMSESGVRPFTLRQDSEWERAWDEFEDAVARGTRLLYLSNPNLRDPRRSHRLAGVADVVAGFFVRAAAHRPRARGCSD
jgi:hypothetical protein